MPSEILDCNVLSHTLLEPQAGQADIESTGIVCHVHRSLQTSGTAVQEAIGLGRSAKEEEKAERSDPRIGW